MIRATEVPGPDGLLRVEQSWQSFTDEAGRVVGWALTQISAELDGDLVFWPRSAELADAYAAADPEFRAWLDYDPPGRVGPR